MAKRKPARKAAKPAKKLAKKPVKPAKKPAQKAAKRPAKKAARKPAKRPARSAARPSANQPAMDPASQLIQLIMGFMVTKAVSASAKLGIADALAAGPRYYTALASAVGADQKALHRMMRALASIGVFAETAPGTYGLTPISEQLRSGVPGSLRDMAVMITAPSHWLPWGRLEDTIRKGVSVADEVFGQPLWEYFRQNEEEGAIFNAAMTSFSSLSAGAILEVYDFSRFRRIVDIGGGHGFLLSAILGAAPKAQGVLFDLPQVVQSSFALPAEIAERLEVVGGSFFTAVPPGGDCYTLKHIIHDWPDTDCRTILQNIRRVMAPDARVLIFDQVVPPETSPHPAFMMDMNMLAMTPGGCERTEKEFRDLLASAGLKLRKVIHTPSPVSVIEAVAA